MRAALFRFFCISALLLSLPAFAVNLKDEELPSFAPRNSAQHGAGEQWFDRIELSGNLGLGSYYGRYHFRSSGPIRLGTLGSDGHVYVDGNLYLDAKVADNLSAFFEWHVTGGMSPWHFNYNSGKPVDIGEAYLKWKDFASVGFLGDLTMKVGAFDLPFGEEYLWQDKIDNPMILSTAAWPWAIDQGVLISGKRNDYGWIASFTDGSATNLQDEHPSKAYNVKIYGKPLSKLYTSLSLMKNGTYTTPALWLGDNTFPKGINGGEVKGFSAGEFDLISNAADWLEISANFGALKISDDSAADADRTLHWWMFQPKVWVSDKVYTIARYSEFGANQAYKWMYADPAITSSTSPGLLYQNNLKKRIRYELGVGYKANPNTLLKLELARDKFRVDGGSIDPAKDNLDFVGAEVAVKF